DGLIQAIERPGLAESERTRAGERWARHAAAARTRAGYGVVGAARIRRPARVDRHREGPRRRKGSRVGSRSTVAGRAVVVLLLPLQPRVVVCHRPGLCTGF